MGFGRGILVKVILENGKLARRMDMVCIHGEMVRISAYFKGIDMKVNGRIV
jgi:hypothetical protein